MALCARVRWSSLARTGRRTTHSDASSQSAEPLIRIPRANVYRFGEARKPVLYGLDLTVHEGESWAVVGAGASVDGKNALLDVCPAYRMTPHTIILTCIY